MKKNYLLIIAILISLVLLVTINNKTTNNTILIKDTIDFLCSEEYRPRVFATENNRRATDYLEELVKNLNLAPVFEDSYLHEINRSKNYSVVGKFPGKNNKEALVITAHFDAYNVVLDNTSGVAVLIDMITELSNDLKDNIPSLDIVICFINGEERALVGSSFLVPDLGNLYENLYNINIDCVGSKKAGALALKNLSRLPNSVKLNEDIKAQLKKDGIKFEDVFASEKVEMLTEQGHGVSDYINFEKNGYPNINISQVGVSELTEIEEDGIDTLDFKNLKKLSDSLRNFVLNF